MRCLLVFMLFLTVVFCERHYETFYNANVAMQEENYDEAIDSYESILKLGYISSDLYYNLGNAYYRKDNLGQAIWAYRNALGLNPRDSDAKHNLSIANARIIDRIEMPKSFFILELYRAIKTNLNTKEWFFVASILLVIQALWFLFVKINIIDLKISKSILFILTATNLVAHGICFDYYFQQKRENSAVVIKNECQVLSGPSYNNTVLFIVNDGSMVEIVSTQKDWSEIILLDGKKGWLQNKLIRGLD